MYCSGQTLVHKKTKKLARLATNDDGPWAWSLGEKTRFIDEHGVKFTDDIDNYTYVRDELDRPYSRGMKKGEFVNMSAKKYLVSKEELAKMREKRLLKWEQEVLDKMSGKIRGGICDIPGKSVSNPFCDGSRCCMAEEFFLKKHKAKPLYKTWSERERTFTDCREPSVFRHTDGQIWMFDNDDLQVIELSNLKEVV